MNETKKNLIKWDVPEFRKPKRGRNWYIIAASLAFLMIFFSFFSLSLKPLKLVFLGNQNNFLFALIIVLIIIIMIISESREERMIRVELSLEGLKLGNSFYEYEVFKNFCVLYKPRESVKQLYFEFKNPAKFRLSIPLRSLNALEVRNFLTRFLEEDLERVSPPLSEQLTKVLKL